MTTPVWTPSSQYLPQSEPDVWKRIESLYGKPFARLEAPGGHRFRMRKNGEPEFYPPVCGQRWLGGHPLGVVGPVSYDWDEPRLILEPIPEPKPKEYVIRLRETGEVREARCGDWFAHINGAPDRWLPDTLTTRPHPILRVVSREAV